MVELTARERAEAMFDEWGVDCLVSSKSQILDDIVALVQAAERSAIERAAKVAEGYEVQEGWGAYAARCGTKKDIIQAIRSLIT